MHSHTNTLTVTHIQSHTKTLSYTLRHAYTVIHTETLRHTLHTHTNTHTHIHSRNSRIHLHTLSHTYTISHMHSNAHTIHSHTYKHSHSCIHTYTHTHIHSHTNTHIHMHSHIHILIQTVSYTQILSHTYSHTLRHTCTHSPRPTNSRADRAQGEGLGPPDSLSPLAHTVVLFHSFPKMTRESTEQWFLMNEGRMTLCWTSQVKVGASDVRDGKRAVGSSHRSKRLWYDMWPNMCEISVPLGETEAQRGSVSCPRLHS